MSKVSHFHKTYHTHNEQKAQIHADHAEAHRTMMDHHEEGTPGHNHHKTKHSLHKREEAVHAALAAYHEGEMKKTAADELNKADGSAPAYLEDAVRAVFLKMFGNTLQPTAVSAVTPDNPRIRAVPRNGQQPIPAAPNVEPQFAKLVSVDNEEAPGVM